MPHALTENQTEKPSFHNSHPQNQHPAIQERPQTEGNTQGNLGTAFYSKEREVANSERVLHKTAASLFSEIHSNQHCQLTWQGRGSIQQVIYSYFQRFLGTSQAASASVFSCIDAVNLRTALTWALLARTDFRETQALPLFLSSHSITRLLNK